MAYPENIREEDKLGEVPAFFALLTNAPEVVEGLDPFTLKKKKYIK